MKNFDFVLKNDINCIIFKAQVHSDARMDYANLLLA